ncbi:MAG TPA: ABC transporter substrate-binding protein [Solirubrobacteraceae bacterium]|nr:ABC transporter substrate-binding protein [Solirubrobacteraceae bacterium]
MQHHRSAALLACALVVALAGCGSSTPPTKTGGSHDAPPPPPAAKALTIFTDLSVEGPTGATGSVQQQQDVANGARLALEQSGHRVVYGRRGRRGSFHVYLVPMDDADPTSGSWSQGTTAANAQRAASTKDAVAYIGDFESAATALSLPALSAGGILQVSPWSPYVGFTDANPADGKGDPQRYYPPNGPNSFARVIPSDLSEANAILDYMSAVGVTRLYVLGDVSVFDAAIAEAVANEAPYHGITVVDFTAGIDTQTNTQPLGYAQIASGVAAQRPDAILLGGTPTVGAIALWRELHAMMPAAKLFAPSTLATPAFLSGIAGAGGHCTMPDGLTAACAAPADATYVTSPILLPRQYPVAARRVLTAYAHRFGLRASVYALYGYAAMEAVLDAIRAAGRYSTVHNYFLGVFFHHLGVIHGVLGNYTINGHGDSSLATFDGYRVTPSGALRFDREIFAG